MKIKYQSTYPLFSKNNLIAVESISVYDIFGQLVIAVPDARNVSTLNVSKLRTGNYLLKIKSDKGEKTKKIIKE